MYGDLSDLYLGVKNIHEDTPEFLTLCPCVNLCSFLSIFGHFKAIPATFSSVVAHWNHPEMAKNAKKHHKFRQGDKVRNSDVFLLLFFTAK